MVMQTKFAGAMLFGALAALSAPVQAGSAVTEVRPMAAFVRDIGGRQVVGYYMADGGACAVTLMLADPASEAAPAAAATRLRLTLQPMAAAAIDAPEGGRLAVTCGSEGRALAVDSQPMPGRLASR